MQPVRPIDYTQILPRDLKCLITTFLPENKDILSLNQVNKEWHAATQDLTLWTGRSFQNLQGVGRLSLKETFSCAIKETHLKLLSVLIENKEMPAIQSQLAPMLYQAVCLSNVLLNKSMQELTGQLLTQINEQLELLETKERLKEEIKIQLEGHLKSDAKLNTTNKRAIKIIQKLIDAGAHVNYTPLNEWTTVLYQACCSANVEVVRLLTRAKASLTVADYFFGFITMLNALLLGQPDISLYEEEYVKVIDILLESGTDVNGLYGQKTNALSIATDLQYHKIKEFLMSKGAKSPQEIYDLKCHKIEEFLMSKRAKSPQ